MRSLFFIGATSSRWARWGTVALAAMCVAVTSACAAREYHVRGTVTAVDPTQIEIRHKSGQVVAIALRPTTAYRSNHTPASETDVEVGARVMVLFDQHKAPFAATEVRIFTRPTRAPRDQSPSMFPGSLGSRLQE